MDDQLDDPYGFRNMIMSKTPKVASHEDFGGQYIWQSKSVEDRIFHQFML